VVRIDLWKRRKVPLAVRWVLIALFACSCAFYTWRCWNLVWVLNSLSAAPHDRFSPEAIDRLLAEADRTLERAYAPPSLDEMYPIASPETLNMVLGRWQIIEDWSDGLCWYSWERTQREGRYELRVMEVSDHFLQTATQHPWQSEPQLKQAQIERKRPDGTTWKTIERHTEIVVFDIDGPGSFLSSSETEHDNNQFIPQIRGFPSMVANGTISRGIVVPDNDRLYLFSTTPDEVGQEIPSPEWVPLRPRCEGTQLTVLRKFPVDWMYPPAGVNVAAVQEKFEPTTPRFPGDQGPLFEKMDATAKKMRQPKDPFPLGVAHTYRTLDEMLPQLRQVYEDSLKRFENP